MVFLFLLASFHLLGREISTNISYKTFEDAEVALGDGVNYLRFVIESTKLGFLTSEVEGFVLKHAISGELDDKNQRLSKMKINFKVKQMNTDNDSRDEKMHGHCLDSSKYSDINVEILSDYKIGSGQKSLPATIEIRGKKKNINVLLKVSKQANQFLVEGKSLMKFSSLEIPSPSISIASVSDNINVDFKLLVNP